MISNEYRINECNKYIYVKTTNEGYAILYLYIDDILIVGSNEKMMKDTKNMLNSKFDMKDMRLADLILGIQIK